MALLVDVEGIDGSGKGTQAGLLRERVRNSGLKCELLSFPRYSATLFGKAVGDFLNGRFGSLHEVNPFLVSLLYAGDRFESRDFLAQAISNNDVVVLDRYVASNVAHQGAKLDGERRAELIDWITRIEFEIYGLPQPDIVLLLHLPVVKAQQFIAAKSAREYTTRKADLQEADAVYLERVRNVYLDLATRDPRWNVVKCAQLDRVRSIDEIADEIWRIVELRLR